VGLWLLPALTLLQVMGRVRAIMEHAGYLAGKDQRLNARTIVRPSWQTFFFGPHAVHFHIEHHENVRVPFYRLSGVHRAMASQGLLPASNLYRGYGAILREVTRA
jgi:fatty acid desaturase